MWNVFPCCTLFCSATLGCCPLVSTTYLLKIVLDGWLSFGFGDSCGVAVTSFPFFLGCLCWLRSSYMWAARAFFHKAACGKQGVWDLYGCRLSVPQKCSYAIKPLQPIHMLWNFCSVFFLEAQAWRYTLIPSARVKGASARYLVSVSHLTTRTSRNIISGMSQQKISALPALEMEQGCMPWNL